MKRLIAFDLDGTLAASKQPIDPATSGLLARLVQHVPVAIISGGDWPQFIVQVVDRLPPAIDFSRLSLLPTSGAKRYRFEGQWRCVHADLLHADERARIIAALQTAVATTDLAQAQCWGDRIEDRGSQITLSALGQQAPPAAKLAWDPDRTRREALRALLVPMLPGFAVRIGGSTSIDVTRAGVDKAWGLLGLARLQGLATSDIAYIGDALYPGGNDRAVADAGIDCIAVRDEVDTRLVITTILLCG